MRSGASRSVAASARAVGVGALLLIGWILAGCGSDTANPAVSTPSTGVPAFGVSAAQAVLAEFDRVDSQASSAGDLAALAGQETAPSLDFSAASVRTAQTNGRSQPSFAHVNASFAIPTGSAANETPECFLATATLQLSGQDHGQTDVSQFEHTAGGWKLSHNVQLARGAVLDAPTSAVAALTGEAVAAGRRQALAAELFARAIAAGPAPDGAGSVAANTLLDQRLAAGWTVYQQQLAAAGMAVSRQLLRSQWSTCAARSGDATLAFVALYSADSVTPTPTGPPAATLSARSPDVIATGHHEAVTGKKIIVSRTQIFLVRVPDSVTVPVTVLGLNDAATALSASA